VLGWCTGAHIALKLSLTFPERVSAMVLLNGGYNVPSIPDTTFQINMRQVMSAAAGSPVMADMYFRAMYEKEQSSNDDMSLSQGSDSAQQKTRNIFDSTDTSLLHLTAKPYESADNLHRYGNLIDAFIKDDDYQGIESLTTPALVVTAKDDETTGYLGSIYVSNALQNSTLVIPHFGDHFLLYLNADFIADQINDFLNQSVPLAA